MARINLNEIVPADEWAAPMDEEALTPSLVRGRQRYLDAFHMPAAAIRLADGKLEVAACNGGFHGLADALLSDAEDGAGAILADFLTGPVERRQFTWCKPGFGGRHYQVHLSQLCPSGSFERRALVSLVDRTAEIETERALRVEMLRDSLTGLPNRQAFIDRVEAAAAEGRRFTILAVDLVRFSRVNEGVGALAGDELVLTVARRLRSVLGPEDMLARTAGDEFGVLVAQAARPQEALQAAERLRDSLATPVRLSDLEIRIDAAVGCAIHGDAAGATAADAIANVQVSLKCAKRTGRVELFQPGEAGRVRRRFTLETDLRRAIERDELSLAFQPLLDLDTGAVTGFEALARWTKEEGAVSPAEFIPVAEESGLIVPLGRWALDRAARTLADWDRRAGARLPIGLSVNVSAVQLARDSLVDAVEASRMDLSRLTLEITESSLVADPERVRTILGALHDRRCRVAMDDFGTGYSCLAYLQRLPIDVLKIDRSLVTEMHGNRDSMAIVRAVLSLARALGLSTTAEGIENTETATLLTALGCTTGQGYLFARPLEPDRAFNYLSAGARN